MQCFNSLLFVMEWDNVSGLYRMYGEMDRIPLRNGVSDSD